MKLHHLILSLVLLLSQAAPAAVQTQRVLESADLARLQWRNLGPARPSGRVTDLAILESKPETFYVATATGGAWKTTTNGATWTPVWEGSGSVSLGAIALAPSNPDVIWLGTGEAWNARISSYGDGVYKSEDGGKTWQHMGLRNTHYIGRIAVHPDDENTVYVAALGSLWGPNEERGLFKTTDGGQSWEKVLYGNPHTGVVEVVLDPSDPENVFAATYRRERRAWNFIGGGPENGLHKSTDGGKTWTELRNGLPELQMGRIGLSICASQPGTLYAAVEAQGNAGGIFRSRDRGASWVRRTGQRTTRLDYGKLNCDPNDPESVWLMHVMLSRSDDGGKTFSNDVVGPGGHADWRTMWINPEDSDHLIAGSDGGVYFSHDRGRHWSFIRNLPVSQLYDVAVDMQEPFYYVYGGLQDNGTFGGPSGTRYTDGITNADWKQTTAGDGFYVQIDPEDPTIVYSESQYGTLYRFDTRTGERRFIQPQPPADGESYSWNWSSPLLLSKHDRKTLYFGANHLFRSPNRGDRWDVISPDLTRQLDPLKQPVMGTVWPKDAVAYHAGTADYGSISTISESPLLAGLLAVGTDDGLIQLTTDDGETWRRAAAIPGFPEQAWVTRVLLSGHATETLYATIDAHHDNDFGPYVARSTDLGRTWRSITGNLPGFGHARAIAEHPRNPNLLFLGTEFGVFLTLDGGKRWVPLKNNLPTANVYDLLIHPRENDLVIATHGRGFWILDDIGILEGLGEAMKNKAMHIAAVRPATQLHPHVRSLRSIGVEHFSAPNPPSGAIINYYIDPDTLDSTSRIEVDVLDAQGAILRRLEVPQGRDGAGIQRVVWDLRYPLPYELSPEELRDAWRSPPHGPFVMPGEYWIRVREGDQQMLQSVKVVGDPAIAISPEDRALWHDTLRRLAELDGIARSALAAAQRAQGELEAVSAALNSSLEVPLALHAKWRALQAEVESILGNLQGARGRNVAEQPKTAPIARRLREVYRQTEASTARPTEDQLRITRESAALLEAEVARLDRLLQVSIPKFNEELDDAGIPWTPGRAPMMPPRIR